MFLVAHTISGFAIGTDSALVLAWAGFLTSWAYLRFFKKQTDFSSTGQGDIIIKGDASETFAFASFWPDIVQPPIAALADGIYNALVAVRVLTPFSAEDVETSNNQASVRSEGGLPSLMNPGGRAGARGGKREEAERRRALALKALDQKLNADATNKSQASGAPQAIENPEQAANNSAVSRELEQV